MPNAVDLEAYSIRVATVLRNPPPAVLYEEAVRLDDARIASNGALVALSGPKTGRSPKDKRIVDHPASSDEIWWGDVNMRLDERTFVTNRQRAIDFFNTRARLYVVDGYVGWSPEYRVKVRVLCARPYHALFMHNLLIRPDQAELARFGDPDYVIFNAGQFPANTYTPFMTSATSISLSLERREMVILGTEYAGEMKKGVFTIMNYLLPRRGVLSMHCSANEGETGDVSLFFGLSGTGKTTLSADPRRRLIGDDEHAWTDEGIFNLEGGCYAKCIRLSPQREPEIFRAIRFGTVLENVVCDEATRDVDYDDDRITENTRAAYPLEFIDRAKMPAIGGHPRNIFLLTCDAFGVLPPVSRLTLQQALYFFLSGYTAKVAGTEVGVTEPQATFSACFGAAFLVHPPARYAQLLAQRLRKHGTRVWLINTGWTGGSYGTGRRIPLANTRAMIDAIHSGALDEVAMHEDEIFGLQVPAHCPGVPPQLLQPRETWDDPARYDAAALKLARRFEEHFAAAVPDASEELRAAGPRAVAAAR
jgi:phosphoenolpyruvate carboxykinase (ATP)